MKAPFLLLAVWLALALTLWAQAPAVTAPAVTPGPVTDVPVHDPVMIREGGTYYLFATGLGVAVWSSPDRVHWTREKPVFATPPSAV